MVSLNATQLQAPSHNSAIDLAQKVTTLVVQKPTVVHIPFKELQSKGIL